jgi:hypothetical protein
MPLNATVILASGDTGSYFSAVGTGADDGLTAQLVGWPAAVMLELVAAGLLAAVVVGPAVGVLDEHAAMEIVAAIVALNTSPAMERFMVAPRPKNMSAPRFR